MDKKKVRAAGFKRGVDLRGYGPGVNVIYEIDSLWPPAVLSKIPGGSKFSKYNRSGSVPARGTKIRKELDSLWTAYGNAVIDGFHAKSKSRRSK